jgi:hypothetical protein
VVFERSKFVLRFVDSYRRSRKAGGSAVPESVAQVWCDPEASCGLADGGWFGDGALQITASHLGLLRQARFAWDGAERGAPMLDPERPYGRGDLLVQLGEAFGAHDADTLARRHVEMFFVIARALKHGALAPGRYALGNTDAKDVREAMHGYGGDDGVSDTDLGLDTDGRVTLTDDHLQLLRAIEIRWPSAYDCEDRLDTGGFPAAMADPKRPYGDFTYIEVDMARILGVLPPRQEGDGPAIFEPGPELALRLQRLHWQMLVAMQVFIEQMDLDPGVYGLHADG